MVIEGGDIYVTRGQTRKKWLYRFGGENERGRRCSDVRGLFRTLGLRDAAFGHRGPGGYGLVRGKIRQDTWWYSYSFKCTSATVREHVGE